MCGISGILSTTPILRENIEIITQALAHRGPDAQAVYISPDESIAIGHRRLSVIDLTSEANQPMHSLDGRYSIVFNGEIYNYLLLRSELMNSGVQFRTLSDTEILLAGFEKWGVKVLDRLEGMFAFAILDQHEKKLFLARDRIGKKPLYYYCSSKFFLFASEPKAILRYPECKPQIDRNALINFLHTGYIPEPLSGWEGIFKFPAGTWAEISAPDHIQFHQYWSIENADFAIETTERSILTQFHSLLTKSIGKRLKSDVPLGALLSGGTDSSLVCAIANELLGGRLKTFNIGFDDQKFNEHSFADRVARELRTEHYSHMLSSKDAIQYLEEYLLHFDEPFADTSAIPTLMVSRKTREQVTVALTGDGGDELFLGYGSYRWAERLKMWQFPGNLLSGFFKKLPHPYAKAGEMFSRPWEESLRSHLFAVEQGFFTHAELSTLVDQPYSPFVFNNVKFFQKSEAERQALFDLKYYLKDDLLVKVDRASMRYALECRCPLLDHRLIEFAIDLPLNYKIRGSTQKYLPKKLLERYLPKDLIYRPKWGFSVPLDKWLRTELCYMINDHLSESNVDEFGFVKAKKVSILVKRFLQGDSTLYHRIWILIVLHYWLRKHAS